MKVIQSFVPTNYQQDLDLYLDLTEASVNSISKYYNDVVLYTTPEIAELVRERKIKKIQNNYDTQPSINIDSKD